MISDRFFYSKFASFCRAQLEFSFFLFLSKTSWRWEVKSRKFQLVPLTIGGEIAKILGAFHSTQNSGNFGWYIKWNGPFRFGPTGIFGTSFEGGPLWPVWVFRSVGLKSPFSFDKIVVPSTALLYPAYKRTITTGAVAWVGSMQPECTITLGTWNFRNFKPKFLLNGKRPLLLMKNFPFQK